MKSFVKLFLFSLFAVSVGFVVSCSDYKARLIVEVRDSSDKALSNAYVILIKEEKARRFKKGVDEQPRYYLLDSTKSNGTVKLRVPHEEQVYGIVAKPGYLPQDFLINSELGRGSKSKILVKLGKDTRTQTLSGADIFRLE